MLASAFSMTAAVYAEETTKTPAFAEDFSSYTAENTAHHSTDTSYEFYNAWLS